MSTCISRHGEFGAHQPDEDHVCTLCHTLDEDALIAEVRQLRERVAELEARVAGTKAQIQAIAEAIRAGTAALTAALDRSAEMSSQPSSQPGPAKGLHTHVRPSAEHRDRNARGSFTTIRADHFGFTPPSQEEQQ